MDPTAFQQLAAVVPELLRALRQFGQITISFESAAQWLEDAGKLLKEAAEALKNAAGATKTASTFNAASAAGQGLAGLVKASQGGGNVPSGTQALTLVRQFSAFQAIQGGGGVPAIPGQNNTLAPFGGGPLSHLSQSWRRGVSVEVLSATIQGGGGGVGGGGGAAGGLSGLGSLAGKVASNPVTAVLSFGVALTALTKVVEGHARSLLQGQDHLKQFNATIALASAKLEIGDLLRNIQTGRNTQESFAALAGGTNALANTTQPFKDAASSVQNVITAGAAVALQKVLEPFVPIAEGLNKLVEEIAKKLNILIKDNNPEGMTTAESIEVLIRERMAKLGRVIPQPVPEPQPPGRPPGVPVPKWFLPPAF